MIQAILSFLFACSHRHRSWPRQSIKGAYEVCLDCGAKVEYQYNELIEKA